ncbi:MAG: aldo/keto reductase [Cyclobacteriaceae bacterium]|nr:aldo/keto reductase [Cyclobacteriaceae bacterium]
MKTTKAKFPVSRRSFIKRSSALVSGVAIGPYLNFGRFSTAELLKRSFGRCDFEVTTMGLGGQASLQWTPADVDPVRIIRKAFDQKINYYDTSNLYGPSQMNFGSAFQSLDLVPGTSGYNEKLRRSIFLASKTHLRWAKHNQEVEGVANRSNGNVAGGTVSDLKRSLSQMFGDGQGNFPEGAYLDMMLIHNLNTMEEVDALYTGLENTDPQSEMIGALAALRDYRDGTNRTGLNPGEEKLIRHIGFSGHFSAPVMMEMIRRDNEDILDAMLVAINANDLLNLNMQYNVIPVAKARNMGIIAMKVFADGAMYTKEATWSNIPAHVVRTVGSSALPSRPLIEYVLSTSGINTAIIGIGQISNKETDCQLMQNLSSAQIRQDGLSSTERKEIEHMTRYVKDGNTNYFQQTGSQLTSPRRIRIDQEKVDKKRVVTLQWDSALAGDAPLKDYVIYRDGKEIGRVKHNPQKFMEPFQFKDVMFDATKHEYTISSADQADRMASSERLNIESTG